LNLKETVSFFKLDEVGEISHQRERIIRKIEQLKSIIRESDANNSHEASTPAESRQSGKSKAIALDQEFGGPSIQLDDFDFETNGNGHN
jgi:hypothetical protein